MPGWNWQKIKKKLSKTLRLTYCYLKIIRILHPCYNPKIIEDIPKYVRKTSASILMRSYLMINDNENETENENSIT